MGTDTLEDIWNFITGIFPYVFATLVLISILWGIIYVAGQFSEPLWYVQPKGGGSSLYFQKDIYSCSGTNEPDYILVTCKELETNKISTVQASVFQER